MKDNKTVLKAIHDGTATISDDTLEKAVDWIEHKSFQVLRAAMQTEDWQFEYEEDFAKLSGLDLREMATEQMYEGQGKDVAETIDRIMEITIEIE